MYRYAELNGRKKTSLTAGYLCKLLYYYLTPSLKSVQHIDIKIEVTETFLKQHVILCRGNQILCLLSAMHWTHTTALFPIVSASLYDSSILCSTHFPLYQLSYNLYHHTIWVPFHQSIKHCNCHLSRLFSGPFHRECNVPVKVSFW